MYNEYAAYMPDTRESSVYIHEIHEMSVYASVHEVFSTKLRTNLERAF